jgi:hypothetical protein
MGRLRAARVLWISVALVATLVVPASPAGAEVIAGSSLRMPDRGTVGQDGLTGSFTIFNEGDPGPSILITEIRFAPSCGSAPTATELCGAPDLGVFSMYPTAEARGGPECAGLVDVSPPDASGVVTFSPRSPLSVPHSSYSCAVDFRFTVLKRPTRDADLVTVGMQTRTNASARVMGPRGETASTQSSVTVKVIRNQPAEIADFDGDGDTDVSVYRPSSSGWYIEGKDPVFLGMPGDLPVPADYDGDEDMDIAVFRPSVGGWYINGQDPVFFGLDGDIPVPADYDADGDDDIAVFRPSVGGWYIRGQNPLFLGLNGDIPVPARYDSGRRADRAVFRPSGGAWYGNFGGWSPTFFGLDGDVPVPGDYDGDGTARIALFRPGGGGWYQEGPAPPVHLGLDGDIPVPGNYDPHPAYTGAHPSYERAVFRRATGAWFIGSAPPVYLGGPGDIPLPLPHRVYQFFIFTGG